MRHFAIMLMILGFFVLPGCTSQDKVWQYLLTDAENKYYLNSQTLKVNGRIVQVELRRELPNVRYDGARYAILHLDMIPAEQLAKFRSIKSYTANDKEVNSTAFNTPTGQHVPLNIDWLYQPPDTDLAKVAQAVAEYCVSQGLKMETRVAPFVSADFTYAGSVPNIYLFFRPASIRAEGDYLRFDIRLFFFIETADSKYAESTLIVDVPAQLYREVNRKWYDYHGNQLGSDAGDQTFSPLPEMSPGGMILKGVLHYCAQKNIPVRQ